MNYNEKVFMWTEKAKPLTIDDMVLPEELKLQVKEWIKKGKCPNLLLSSTAPGLGKTSISDVISNELEAETKLINASLENGIDTIRNKVMEFASSCSFDGSPKIVIMDECLEENEKVRIGTKDNWKGVKLNELTPGVIYDCVSFNMNTGKFENDTARIISDKVDEIYEVQMLDNRTIKVTGNHPFIVKENNKFIEKSINDGLSTDDEIVFTDDNTKISSITKIDNSRVINLTVHKNHTFITENGIVTHNCDNLTSSAQAAFRGFLDEFSKNCTFIFTCNYKDKIIEPLRNRLVKFDFDDMFANNKKELGKQIILKLFKILDNEGIQYDKSDLKNVLLNLYPSIRDMIMYIQKHSVNNVLEIDNNVQKSAQYNGIIECIKNKDFTKLRQQVSNTTTPDSFYTWSWKNLDTILVKESHPKAILIIAKYQFQSTMAVDSELNLAACCTELLGSGLSWKE